MTAVKEKKPLLSPPNISKSSEWLAVYIASALSFGAAVQYTLYFSSLWPYLQVV